MTSVNISSVTNTVSVSETNTNTISVVTAGPQGPQGPQGDPGIVLDSSAKVDKSIVYYSASEDTFKADSIWTVSSLTDGGNF